MPPALSATSTPPERTSPADRSAPAASPAAAREEPAAQPDAATQARPGSQPADDARLLHELDHVLAAITEHRRAAAARSGTDGTAFADIRAAFAALRHALDLPGPVGNGDTTRPAAAVPDAPQPASPPPGAAQDGPPPPSTATSPISGPPSLACGSPGPARIQRPGPARRSRTGRARRRPSAGPGRRGGPGLRPVVPGHPGMAADRQGRPRRARPDHGDPGGGRGLLGRDPAGHPRPGFRPDPGRAGVPGGLRCRPPPRGPAGACRTPQRRNSTGSAPSYRRAPPPPCRGSSSTLSP